VGYKDLFVIFHLTFSICHLDCLLTVETIGIRESKWKMKNDLE